MLYGDEAKVSQVLRNFISNALKFTEEGEIRVSVQMASEDRVEFSVADTGIGMAPEDVPKIFGEFQQVDNPIQKRVKGTGLGLPLSKKLAELLQGDIRVESTPGVGSIFHLRMPVAYRAPAPAVAAEAIVSERDPFRLPLLVVEDGEDAIHVYRSLLRATEFEIFAVGTVQAARHALRDLEPAAVILDIQLRGQDAWAFLVELKDQRPALPVVVVTNVDDEHKALGLGADAYFAKPAERPWLLHTLRALTRSARPGGILIVDDDELWRYTMTDALRETHFDALEARGGEEGLQRARDDRPTAIFLDLGMPDLDGFTVLERLKSDVETRDIPVIVMTSMVLQPEDLARLPGAARVVSKELLARGDGRKRVQDLITSARQGGLPVLPAVRCSRSSLTSSSSTWAFPTSTGSRCAAGSRRIPPPPSSRCSRCRPLS
jgi:DNA-binding response OmpR family regulator